MSHPKADALKAKYKEGQSKARKHFRDKGYTTVKEKTYFDYGHRDRHNIRTNAKDGSNMHKRLRSKPYEVTEFKKRFGL